MPHKRITLQALGILLRVCKEAFTADFTQSSDLTAVSGPIGPRPGPSTLQTARTALPHTATGGHVIVAS
eukprot:1971492-Rhodomonas_salina.3